MTARYSIFFISFGI